MEHPWQPVPIERMWLIRRTLAGDFGRQSSRVPPAVYPPKIVGQSSREGGSEDVRSSTALRFEVQLSELSLDLLVESGASLTGCLGEMKRDAFNIDTPRQQR